jgi:triosephosphate isomerase (TIM)
VAAEEPRRPLVVGDWSMNLNHYEANRLVQHLAHSLTEKELAAVEVAVLPAFTSIRSVQTAVDGDKWLLRYGAQDISPHVGGRHPGEVSGAMLAKLGCAYVLIGHSVRRTHHHEDDALVNAKVKAALANGIAPLVCVGDGVEAHEAGTGTEEVLAQLRAGLAGLTGTQMENVVICYEPVWAGSDAPPPKPTRGAPLVLPPDVTPAEVQAMAAAIRGWVATAFNRPVAAQARVLYAGRVNGVTIAALMAEPDIDGALVGPLSLDPVEFVKICRLGEPAA